MRTTRTLGRTLGTLFLVAVAGLSIILLVQSCAGNATTSNIERHIEEGHLVP